MTPPNIKNKKINPNWWMRAYEGLDHIDVTYELVFGKDIIKPGTLIKLKYIDTPFKFRCVAHNVGEDSTWIDAVNTLTGEWKSFRIDKLKSIIKPKRSRRHKTDV